MVPLLILATLGASPNPPAGAEEQARAFLRQLDEGRWQEAQRHLSAQMKKALPGDALARTWGGVEGQLGKLKELGTAEVQKVGAHTVVDILSRFERERMVLRVALNAQGEVDGFFVRPPPKQAPDSPPYARRDAFREEEVTVGKGTFALSGTLSLPKGATARARVPAVVLVHGSGPNDRDETVGATKPFRDLAWGLASRGVAVLRYDKRTRVHAKKLAGVKAFTVKEETVDDAVLAVKLLQSRKEIDSGRVFVLGHSLGGMLAPRIARRAAKIAGVILLAAPADAKLQESFARQVHDMAAADGAVDEAERAAIEQAKRQFAASVPASYWNDLKGYDPVGLAKKVGKPALVLQGGRDYQVLPASLKTWESGLKGLKGSRFRLFPALNHLFVEGKGRSTPAEYAQPGTVSGEVVEAIADWVKTTAR